MERFNTLFFVAGLGCFAIAAVLSMVFPWMTLHSYHGMDYQTLEDLAAVPSEEFEALSTRFPEAFAAAYGEVSPESYATALQRGRDLYVGQACWHCHSQYVRVVSNEDLRFGPASTAQEYQNALSQPHLWGTRRVGPDLSREKGKRTNDWHIAHLINPQERRFGLGHAGLRLLVRGGRHPQGRRIRHGHVSPVVGNDRRDGRGGGPVTSEGRTIRRAVLGFFVLAVTAAGCMFTYKLFAFLKTIKRDELAGFAFDPILIYALVAMGFLCLLAWAFLTGQFRDLERAKYDMLERFEEQERAEGVWKP